MPNPKIQVQGYHPQRNLALTLVSVAIHRLVFGELIYLAKADVFTVN